MKSRLLALIGVAGIAVLPFDEAAQSLERSPTGPDAEQALQALHNHHFAAAEPKKHRQQKDGAEAKATGDNESPSQDDGTEWDDWMGESTLSNL